MNNEFKLGTNSSFQHHPSKWSQNKNGHIIIIVVIIIIMSNIPEKNMKSRNYGKQPYWTLHTYFGK